MSSSIENKTLLACREGQSIKLIIITIYLFIYYKEIQCKKSFGNRFLDLASKNFTFGMCADHTTVWDMLIAFWNSRTKCSLIPSLSIQLDFRSHLFFYRSVCNYHRGKILYFFDVSILIFRNIRFTLLFFSFFSLHFLELKFWFFYSRITKKKNIYFIFSSSNFWLRY